jgi:hypothetical protein
VKTQHITNIVIEMDNYEITVYVYRNQEMDDLSPSGKVYRPSVSTFAQVESILKAMNRNSSLMLNWFNFNPISGVSVISFMPVEYWEKHVKGE